MFAGIMWNYEALLSYLAELLALQMLEELLKPFQLSVGIISLELSDHLAK